MDIRLTLKQGLTGTVFTADEHAVALRIVDGDRDWDSKFNMTEELEKVVHPDLQWILSLPVFDSQKRVMAVLNVDGLVHRFSYDVLFDCVPVLGTDLMLISPFLHIHRGKKEEGGQPR